MTSLVGNNIELSDNLKDAVKSRSLSLYDSRDFEQSQNSNDKHDICQPIIKEQFDETVKRLLTFLLAFASLIGIIILKIFQNCIVKRFTILHHN